jgi:hypothetical protein
MGTCPHCIGRHGGLAVAIAHHVDVHAVATDAPQSLRGRPDSGSPVHVAPTSSARSGVCCMRQDRVGTPLKGRAEAPHATIRRHT